MSVELELFYSPTPNGWKITILLEEAGIPYVLRPINLAKGEQFSAEFQKLSPNGRMPAIRLTYPDGSVESVFESGAIMLRLAEVFPDAIGAHFAPLHLRRPIYEWLFWMNANLGPNAGQVSHFTYYAPKISPGTDFTYPLQRYKKEFKRCVSVLDRQLQVAASQGPSSTRIGDCDTGDDGVFLLGMGQYTVADMAIWPWVKPFKRWMGQSLEEAGFPHAAEWYERLKQRPKLRQGVGVLKNAARAEQHFRESKVKLPQDVQRNMFGQTQAGIPAARL